MDKYKNKKVILITGGAGTLGTSLAKELKNKKYKIILGDININRLRTLKENLNSEDVEIFKSDLTKKKGIDDLINFALKKFKKIDAAVHCFYPRSQKYGNKFENLNEKYLKEDLGNHLGGTIIFCQRIIKLFLKQKKGNLILISSIQGTQAPKFDHYIGSRYKGSEMVSPIEYSAIKSGIISITKYLSKYYRNKNLKINCISPGGIKDNEHPKRFIKKYRQSCNTKGLLDGSDISKLILFLLSEESKYISGQNLIIDDGWSL